MRTCTKRLEFDAGHRLVGHESKCRNAHGHRYMLEVTCGAERLDDVGRVIDFGRVKELVGGWIDERIDHGFLCEASDPLALAIDGLGLKLYIVDVPPTAENLVVLLYRQARRLLEPHGVRVLGARLYETPTCWADYGEPAEPR